MQLGDEAVWVGGWVGGWVGRWVDCLRGESIGGEEEWWVGGLVGGTYRCFCSASSISRLNHSSNWSEEEKTSGRRKLRRAQSSCRLFCLSGWVGGRVGGLREGDLGGRFSLPAGACP